MKDQTLCAWGHTGTRSQPWRWGEHPAAPTDETLSVQQGLALTLQPTPTLDLWTQPGPWNDEVTLWEPGSVSVTCEHTRLLKDVSQQPDGYAGLVRYVTRGSERPCPLQCR